MPTSTPNQNPNLNSRKEYMDIEGMVSKDVGFSDPTELGFCIYLKRLRQMQEREEDT